MKTILITGISRGIGKALALKFSGEGYYVIGTSTSGKIEYELKNSEVFKLDLSLPKSIEKCAKEIAESGKKIDILINNAGIVCDEETKSMRINIEKLRKVLEVNLIGTADFSEYIIPLMNEGGHIISISSGLGSLEFGGMALVDDAGYKISKVGLNMLTRILAARLKGRITVSSVRPGYVKTDMTNMKGEMEPSEAAEHIFKLAESHPETGQFWYKGERFPW